MGERMLQNSSHRPPACESAQFTVCWMRKKSRNWPRDSEFSPWVIEHQIENHGITQTEACLAHSVQSKVEAAYARSDLLNRQRILMQAWADYLSDTA